MKITKRVRLLFLWTLGTSLGPVLAVIFYWGFLFLLVIAFDCEVVDDMIHPIQNPPICTAILWYAIPPSLLLPGLVQWLVLRSQGLIRHAWWILLSAVAGGLFFWPGTALEFLTSNLSLIWIFTLAGLLQGLAQWLVLRRSFEKAWVWIPGSAAGALLSGVLAYALSNNVLRLLSLVPYGLITGVLLVWLVDQRTSHQKEVSALNESLEADGKSGRLSG